VLAESQDEEQIIARVAALDIGKAELVCCVRVPAEGSSGKRLQEVSTHSTMTRSLTELANHLVELGVERVVMEATSDYWRISFYLLGAACECNWSTRRRPGSWPAEDRPARRAVDRPARGDRPAPVVRPPATPTCLPPSAANAPASAANASNAGAALRSRPRDPVNVRGQPTNCCSGRSGR